MDNIHKSFLEEIVKISKKKSEAGKTFRSALAGGLAGTAAAVATQPITVAKTLQETGTKGNIFKIMKKLYRKSGGGMKGAKRMFRGSGGKILTLGPSMAIALPAHKFFTKKLENIGNK